MSSWVIDTAQRPPEYPRSNSCCSRGSYGSFPEILCYFDDVSCGYLLRLASRRKLAYSKKDYEEITLPDGKKVKARISPPLDLDYSWNRGKHWFFRSPYRGGSPFALFLVILAVGLKYGWAAVG